MSIGTHATTRHTDQDGVYQVRYHETVVYQEVTTELGTFVMLNDGGHKSATTKRRINECFEERGIPWKLYQNQGKWILQSPTRTWPYKALVQMKVQ